MTTPKSETKKVPRFVKVLVFLILVGLIGFGSYSVRSNVLANRPAPVVPEPTVEPEPTFAADDPEGLCTHLNLMASSEKASVMTNLAASYNASLRANQPDNCYRVDVSSKASGVAMTELAAGTWDSSSTPVPDVWSPASSSWVSLLAHERATQGFSDILPTETPSIANTPLVIAMPQPMAEALGWPEKELGWSDVLSLHEDPEGWGAFGHAEWGQFRLGKTNPNFSTSGLNATVGTYYAATGLSGDLTLANITDPATAEFVHSIETSVVHYGDTTLSFLSNLQDAADEGRGLDYISAVIMEEKSLFDYNSGNPTGDLTKTEGLVPAAVPLVAVYPKEGTLMSDNPYVTLTGSWVSDAKREVSEDFLAYLLEEPAQEQFLNVGFRGFDNTAGEALTSSEAFNVTQPAIVISKPSGEVLSGIKDAWADQRKRARVLLVMDVSGSMSEPAGDGSNKLELAKAAALDALEDFAPTDEVGLWLFSTDRASDGQPYQELVPPAPVEGNLEALKEQINGLTPDGGTALYATARASVNYMNETFDPERINAVVLLTDGRNEYHQDTDVDSLISTLSKQDASASTRLFTIGYGQDADLATLETMSKASRATSYDASDPETIGSVFSAVISNF